MGNLHIAFFSRSFYPDTTAVGQLVTELCEGLVKDHGCRVSVVAGVPLLSAESGKVKPWKGRILSREWHNGIEILRARGTDLRKNESWAGSAIM